MGINRLTWCHFIIALLTLPAVAHAQFTYVTNSDNVSITITGYTGPGGAVVIPGTINGYIVKNIGANAFFGLTSLTGVAIPYSVTNIGDYAFFGCHLTSIGIPNGVTSIGAFVFSYCTNMASVTIPGSVASIGMGAFQYCTNLTSAYFQGNAPTNNLTIFQGDSSALVYYLPGTTGWTNAFGGAPTVRELTASEFEYVTNSYFSVIITGYLTGYNGPGSVEIIPHFLDGYTVNAIGDHAYDVSNSLPSFIIPDCVISIGDSAFQGCYSLTNITIPNSVTSIGPRAFWLCTNLAAVIIGHGLTNIGNFVFSDCTALTNAYFLGNAPPDDGTAFRNTPATVYYLPGTTGWGSTFGGAPTMEQTTPTSEFEYVTNDDSITITGYIGPGGVVVIPGTVNGYTVNNIGNNAFDDPNSTFDDSNSLVSVTIPESVTSIGQDAFFECRNLTNVRIPNTVTNIGAKAFMGCGLTSVNIPNRLTSIGDSVFFGCPLTSIAIPNSVASIGDSAFWSCTNFTTITVPDSVTSIGQQAFAYCTALTTAYFLGNAPQGGMTAFQNTPATVYYLPGTAGWTGNPFGYTPTKFWYLPQPTILTFEPSFGINNKQFGFTISWATNATVIVQGCTNLANPDWVTVCNTNSVTSSFGSSYFSDPQWTNYPLRFYRVSRP